MFVTVVKLLEERRYLACTVVDTAPTGPSKIHVDLVRDPHASASFHSVELQY